MPTVGRKRFSYTQAGERNAKAYAKRTGKKLRRKSELPRKPRKR